MKWGWILVTLYTVEEDGAGGLTTVIEVEG